VLVAGAKTSLFAKNSRCTFSAEKARLKFFTLINRLLPTHFAMCGGKYGILYEKILKKT